MLTLLYLSNERTDIQSTVRLMCTKLKNPTALEMRQLKRLLRYVKGTEDMSTVFEVRDNNDRREQLVKRLEVYTDSDWASEQTSQKSTSGAVIMVEGMRLHAHSRGQAAVALSTCEAEVMAASQGIKEALMLQEVLMFAGLGHYEIEVKVDSNAAHAFFHRRGVGRMKHIDPRILWLQDLFAAGGVRLKKIPRTQNLADMLTHTPGAKELEVFLPLMGLGCCSERDKELMVTRQYKPVTILNARVYSHGRGGVLRSVGIPAMHDTSLCGLVSFLASYDQYTALVKSGEVTGEHVRRIGGGIYLWWNLDTVPL